MTTCKKCNGSGRRTVPTSGTVPHQIPCGCDPKWQRDMNYVPGLEAEVARLTAELAAVREERDESEHEQGRLLTRAESAEASLADTRAKLKALVEAGEDLTRAALYEATTLNHDGRAVGEAAARRFGATLETARDAIHTTRDDDKKGGGA